MNSIEGKVFMFTGALQHTINGERVTRDQARGIVESLGGIAGSSVTHNTDYLVVGESPGSKLLKAQEYGIKTISEDEFWQLVDSCKQEDTTDEVILTTAQLEGAEPLSDEQLTRIAALPVKIMTIQQLELLLLSYEPSYKNPEKLKELTTKYPNISLLPPTTCRFCEVEIPYSIHTDYYYCFGCRQYSYQDEHQHRWVDPKVPGSTTKAGIYCACQLCDEFLFFRHTEYRDHRKRWEDEDYLNSLEKLVDELEEKERQYQEWKAAMEGI